LLFLALLKNQKQTSKPIDCMKAFSILLASLLAVYPLFCQTDQSPDTESLISEANKHIKDDAGLAIRLAKTVLLNEKVSVGQYVQSTIILGLAYKNKGQYDSSLYFVDSGLEKALEAQDTLSLIKLYSNRGVVYYLKANYKAAVADFRKSGQQYESLGEKIKTDTAAYLDFARVMNNTASAYIKTGQSDSALTYFIQSLKIREAYNAPQRMLIVSKLNIGSIYLAIGDNEQSEIWMKDALAGARQQKDSALMEKCFINLGIVSKKTGDTPGAIQNYRSSLLLSRQLGNARDQAIALQNLALLLSSQKKYNEAYTYFNLALKTNNAIHANNSSLHHAMSRMFVEQQLYDSAIVHGSVALQLAKESGNLEVQMEECDLLSKAFKGKKQFRTAFDYLSKSVAIKDSVTRRENREYIQNQKTEFEIERKENEIVFLKKLNRIEHAKNTALQSRQRLIVIVVLLAIVLFTVVIAFYLSKKKKEKELWLMEKKLLEKDLHNKELLSRELSLEINYKTKQLTTHALNMTQRNQILTEIREKLKKLSKNIGDDLAMDFMSIINDINQMQRTRKDWELFKKYFESINKDFNKKLREINHTLSVNDYRLAALISLNLNIKEAAAVLNISPGSVKLARHRLRKKLGLHTGDDLYVFLNQL
jgi:tetratricopeptide (TPR) repeat protein/DNA-binding CsgD family transcriptional regulator